MVTPMFRIFESPKRYGEFVCEQCENHPAVNSCGERTGKHYELVLKVDQIQDTSLEGDMRKIHVADYCPSCWEELMGLEIEAINFFVQNHDFEEYREAMI